MRLPLRIARQGAESELKHALKRTKAGNTQIRIRAVLAVAKGKTIRQAAQTISIAARTIQNWVNNYNGEGIEGNRVYPDIDALYQAATDAWNETTSKPELIRSLCNNSWIQKENLN